MYRTIRSWGLVLSQPVDKVSIEVRAKLQAELFLRRFVDDVFSRTPFAETKLVAVIRKGQV